MNDRNAIDIARRFAELGQTEDAINAYALAIEQGLDPREELEAAVYIFQSGGDYRISYTSFRSLYNAGLFKDQLLPLMTTSFYEPNRKLLKSRYEKNCKALQKYPYLFRKDFLPFEWLPVRFYPYDDNGYVPFHTREEHFGEYINFNHPVVSRNFFKNLDAPILATDVYSQYELEYLNDNVRKSEWIGRENHIYLHYTDWGEFCSQLAALNIRELLKAKKIVFLIGDEAQQYPIDFRERFGIDYSQYPVRPVGIDEVHRLIWHTQLAAHNGGDFFNEIFDGHPNLIVLHSTMMDSVEETISIMREGIRRKLDIDLQLPTLDKEKNDRVFAQLRGMADPSDKDIFVAYCMCADDMRNVDPASRIAPALFFQPHFHNINYSITGKRAGAVKLQSEQYQTIQNSSIFHGFRYIKAFTPVRRPANSCGATVRFITKQIAEQRDQENGSKIVVPPDTLADRLLNRSFMIDWQDRLRQDCVIVRFEDGKLNPTATFTALAAFLDLPYTHSMTYCSKYGERDPESLEGNDLGFSTAAIYRDYKEYVGDSERCLLEYFMRDLYAHCGYDFQYYDGSALTLEQLTKLLDACDTMDAHILRDTEDAFVTEFMPEDIRADSAEELRQTMREKAADRMKIIHENRLEIVTALQDSLRFVNENGQPLRMTPLLKLNLELLERPLYH